MYQFKLIVDFETQEEKEIFKSKLSGHGIAFDINKIYKTGQDDLILIPINKITKQSELSITYFFELYNRIEPPFFLNLTKNYPKNKYTLTIKKHKLEYWRGGFLKKKFRFGNWMDLRPLETFVYEDFSNKYYRKEINKILHKIIKSEFQEKKLVYNFYSMLQNYMDYDEQDTYKNTFFFKIYNKIHNPYLQNAFQDNFPIAIRQGRISEILTNINQPCILPSKNNI